MSKKTTVKPIALGYREVGTTGSYTMLMGVLKGLSIAQDEPGSTEIEAEFFDAPFDIIYQGNPVTMTFELANYDLSELPALFGGSVSDGIYEGPNSAFTSEHEWKLDFQRGNGALVIYKGLTVGTLKKDADGALNYSVTITALVYNDGYADHMYKILGTQGTESYNVVDPSGAGYSAKNPKNEGWYEATGEVGSEIYRLTWDEAVVTDKDYYTKTIS